MSCSFAHEGDPLLNEANRKNNAQATDGGDNNGSGVIRRRKIQRVHYTPQDHVQVLLQLQGSVLPQVLPFCLSNVVWTLAIYGLKEKAWCDLTFKSTAAHTFMGLLVSFLVVSRSRISYQRYMEIRRDLGMAYLSCRELIQYMNMYTITCRAPSAVAWRQEVAYRTILLLRVTMDALNWSAENRDAWENPSEREQPPPPPPSLETKKRHHLSRFMQYRHGMRTMVDENFRAPVSFSYNLRETIMQYPQYLDTKLAVNEYRDLLRFTSDFNTAFQGFRNLVFTPYPFPLVQMTRWCIFVWVFSLPLVLLVNMDIFWDVLIVVFVLTFGFVGIEYVSMALDDPFGDDAMDFDEDGFAETVYEDIYLALYKLDGPESVEQLRKRVLERYASGSPLENYRKDIRRDTFWEPLSIRQQVIALSGQNNAARM